MPAKILSTKLYEKPYPVYTNTMSSDDLDLKRLAHLSQLHLSDEELASYRSQLASIVDHFDTLAQKNISAAPDTAQALGELGPLRKDKGIRCEIPYIKENAPDFDEQANSFVVPPVL